MCDEWWANENRLPARKTIVAFTFYQLSLHYDKTEHGSQCIMLICINQATDSTTAASESGVVRGLRVNPIFYFYFIHRVHIADQVQFGWLHTPRMHGLEVRVRFPTRTSLRFYNFILAV